MLQGRIKHDRMAPGEADPRPDFLSAHALYPQRAEPLIWMCWHHHKMMDNCTRGPGQGTCWVRHRAAAFVYASRAAALDMPEVDRPSASSFSFQTAILPSGRLMHHCQSSDGHLHALGSLLGPSTVLLSPSMCISGTGCRA